jgi:hypothetical protein
VRQEEYNCVRIYELANPILCELDGPERRKELLEEGVKLAKELFYKTYKSETRFQPHRIVFLLDDNLKDCARELVVHTMPFINCYSSNDIRMVADEICPELAKQVLIEMKPFGDAGEEGKELRREDEEYLQDKLV